MHFPRVAISDLGRVFRGETVAGMTEWQLLQRYVEARDETAFDAILARHAPMVWGVCRRMLDQSADVEDAFQATFLVLVRRARQLGPDDLLGPWLFGVATRVAMRTRNEAARRRSKEAIALDHVAAPEELPLASREITDMIDREISRLPAKYRSPIVLCCLGGQTHEAAARQLGWPVGSVKGRLARARELLRTRLARRGVVPSLAALSGALLSEASANIPHELLDRTTRSRSETPGRSDHRSGRFILSDNPR